MLTNCSRRQNSWEDCDVRQLSSVGNGKDNRRLSAARWTAVELDGQLTLISAHLPHKGKLGEFEAALTEIEEFLNGRPKQPVILGGDFNVNLFGMTDYLHVGESLPRPRTLIDTNDSLRARALHTMVTELDLTVTNTWMNADTERELFTRSS